MLGASLGRASTLGVAAIILSSCGGDAEATYSATAPCGTDTFDAPATPSSKYPLHSNIKATLFWIGEPANEANGQVANVSSSWQDEWQSDFGGADEPAERSGFCPKAFRPRQNPFYVALPYNDLEVSGAQKTDAKRVVPWADEPTTAKVGSMLKNRWVEVSIGERRCYGQWEDAGPFLENDAAYVFGTARPANTRGAAAGINLSPAVERCLGLTSEGEVSWRFLDVGDVPKGPWLLLSTREAE